MSTPEFIKGIENQAAAGDVLVRWLPHYSIDRGRVRFLGTTDVGVEASDGVIRLIERSALCGKAEFVASAGENLFGKLAQVGVVVEYPRRSIPPPSSGGILVVEPHSDDFALSCSGTVAAQRQGEPCEVHCVTVFSEYSAAGFPWRQRVSLSDNEYTRLRLAEAKIAADCFGFRSELLPFEDSLSRGIRLGVRMKRSLRKKDWLLIGEVAERLTGVIAEQQPSAVFLPAAIGWHCDHRIVYAAGLQALKAIGYAGDIRLYEDYPYCDEGRYSCWGRLEEICENFKIRPCYTEIGQTVGLKAQLIGIYRSQFPDWHVERIRRETREFARATSIEGRFSRHVALADKFLAERTWHAKKDLVRWSLAGCDFERTESGHDTCSGSNPR